jgi:hypothetical protein
MRRLHCGQHAIEQGMLCTMHSAHAASITVLSSACVLRNLASLRVCAVRMHT